MAGAFNRVLGRLFPEYALKREAAQVKLDLLQSRRAELFGRPEVGASTYAPVGGGRRSREFYRNSRDANGALRHAREPLSQIARDMLRNNSRVVRANNLFAGYTVGSGIWPVLEFAAGVGDKEKDQITGLIRDHLMTTAIDADGNSTLFGLQALSMKTIPISGEVILRRRLRRASDGLPLPFQIQCLETDYLDATRSQGPGPGGAMIEDGIEYGVTGRAVAYHLHSRHPGSVYGGGPVRRVEAENISLAFMVDRPGQRRGVSWYAPVLPELMDIHKFMQGTLKRQEVAAMFAGILKRVGDDDPDGNAADMLAEVEAGGIIEIDADDTLEWNEPPSAQSAEPVVRLIDRVIASGLMLTYEGFTGDYSNVNYTSGRMGRMDQDPAVRFWQEELIIAKQMAKVADWFKEAVYFRTLIDPDSYRIRWTAPRRPVVDPTKDYPAMVRKVRAGFDSTQSVIREMGRDPNDVWKEQLEDAAKADVAGMVFDTDPRRVSQSGVAQSSAANDPSASDTTETEEGGENA